MSKKRKIHYTMSKWAWLKPRLVWRSIKFAYHRLKYGYDPSYFWNLDYTLVELILEFINKEKTFYSCPGHFKTLEEWHQVLQEIEDGCEEYLNNEDYDYLVEKKKWKRAKKLILEHWEALWI